jgi:hypothetical protein
MKHPSRAGQYCETTRGDRRVTGSKAPARAMGNGIGSAIRAGREPRPGWPYNKARPCSLYTWRPVVPPDESRMMRYRGGYDAT